MPDDVVDREQITLKRGVERFLAERRFHLVRLVQSVLEVGEQTVVVYQIVAQSAVAVCVEGAYAPHRPGREKGQHGADGNCRGAENADDGIGNDAVFERPEKFFLSAL